MAASIVAIGNPGVGKSTTLNALAGENLFKSGVSFGCGLTYKLDEKSNERGRFFDTPGLADDTYRKAAGEAIRDALRTGGPFKVLFFVMTESGRVVRQDVTTLKLVLESCPELENKYGIVINKIPPPVAKGLEDVKNAEVFYAKLFSGIDEDRRCPPSNMTYILHSTDLDSIDDTFIPLESIKTMNGDPFADFVYHQVPTVQLTEGLAKDIDTERYDKENSRLEEVLRALEKRMVEDKKEFQREMDRLHKMLEKAEKEKLEQRQEDRQRHAEQMAFLQKQLESKQQQIAQAQKDADQKIKLEREYFELKLKQQQDEHQRKLAEEARRRDRDDSWCSIM